MNALSLGTTGVVCFFGKLQLMAAIRQHFHLAQNYAEIEWVRGYDVYRNGNTLSSMSC
jgi:hypothetical protein